MKKEFITYFNEIGLSDTLRQELQSRYQLLARFSGVEEFHNILLSEMITQEGNREYLSLWGFTSTMLCKISVRPQTNDKIVLFKLKNNIARITLNDFNYDLINSTITSNIFATIRTFDMDIPYAIRASGKNCDYLLKTFHQYIIPALDT